MHDIHITREMLRAVYRGDLPPRTLAELGYKHLMGLCPHCREEMAAFQGELEAGETGGRVLAALLERHGRDLEKARKAAERDVRDLLRLPHDARLARIGRSASRFRGPLLASMLLDECRTSMPGDLARAREMAEMAEAVLRRSPDGPGVTDASVRTAAYLANLSRMEGDPQEAQRRFHYARYLIRHAGVTDPRLLAEVDSCEAVLFLDQRRFPEAEELLNRSVTLYSVAGERSEAVRPLLSLGLAHYHRGNYAKAIEVTQEAAGLTSPERNLRLYLSARHNLAVYLCEAGKYQAAAEAVREDQALYAQFPDDWTGLRLRWLEGRIALGLEDLEEAEEAFSETRAGFIEAGSGYDAALVSLDLALLYVGQGRTDEIKRLAEEMLAIFQAEEVHREALAAVLLFHEAAQREQVTAERLRELAEYLKAAREGGPRGG